MEGETTGPLKPVAQFWGKNFRHVIIYVVKILQIRKKRLVIGNKQSFWQNENQPKIFFASTERA